MKTLAEHLGIVDLKPSPAPPDNITFDEGMSDADFCRGVLMSNQYRESIQRRILIDELPSAVETMLWDRAFGTRKERVEIDDKRAHESMNDEQLLEHELRLTRQLLQLRKSRTNGTGEPAPEMDDGTPTSVH